jgi:hypothetical protein
MNIYVLCKHDLESQLELSELETTDSMNTNTYTLRLVWKQNLLVFPKNGVKAKVF